MVPTHRILAACLSRMSLIQDKESCRPKRPDHMWLSIIPDHIDHAGLQNHGLAVKMFEEDLAFQDVNDMAFDTPMVSFITRAVLGQAEPDVTLQDLSDGDLSFFSGMDRFGEIFPTVGLGFSNMDVHLDQIAGKGMTGVVSSI